MRSTSYSNSTNSLAHFGVKGMKWGIRRYVDANGRLTEEGRKHYAEKPLTKRQEKISAKWQERGLSKADADIQAKRRTETERLVATLAGVTTAAAATYVATRAIREQIDRVTDRVLTKDSKIGRVATNNKKSVDDAFYVFDNAADRRKYIGYYGQALLDSEGTSVFEKSMNVMGDVKIASRETCRKAFANLAYKDPEFLGYTKRMFRDGMQYDILPERIDLYKKALSDVNQDKWTKSAYDAFNTILVDHSPEGNKNISKFYKALKKEGYSAIQDVNDRSYSGFESKNPLIIFDKNKVDVTAVKELSKEAIRRSGNRETNMAILKAMGQENIKMGVAAVGLYAASKAVSQFAEDNYIKQYLKKHPNTKLNRDEILDTRGLED